MCSVLNQSGGPNVRSCLRQAREAAWQAAAYCLRLLHRLWQWQWPDLPGWEGGESAAHALLHSQHS